MLPQRLAWAWTPHPILRSPDDNFFSEGDALCCQRHKQLAMPTYQEEDERLDLLEPSSKEYFTCQAVDCKARFTTVAQYELHYNSAHRHLCMDCHRTFPTSHLLDVHITEWHNPMFDLLSSKQNMYQCLLETCTERFPHHKDRKDHLVTVHKFPANYRFDRPSKQKSQSKKSQPQKTPDDNTNQTTDTTESMDTDSNDLNNSIPNSSSSSSPFRRNLTKSPDTTVSANLNINQLSKQSNLTIASKQKSNVLSLASLASSRLSRKRENGAPSSDVGMEASGLTGHCPDAAMDTAIGSTTAERRFVYKSTVPKTICFGAGSQRGFGRGAKRGGRREKSSGHWHQTQPQNTDTAVNIEQVNMEELSSALDS